MATPNTTDLDTELSAVNSILGSIGQSPITSLAVTQDVNGNDITPFANPEVGMIYDLLKAFYPINLFFPSFTRSIQPFQ